MSSPRSIDIAFLSFKLHLELQRRPRSTRTSESSESSGYDSRRNSTSESSTGLGSRRCSLSESSSCGQAVSFRPRTESSPIVEAGEDGVRGCVNEVGYLVENENTVLVEGKTQAYLLSLAEPHKKIIVRDPLTGMLRPYQRN